ncbi:MAG: hypothetical protein HQK53_05330 [Oligoflexia bacterium]|nr:hypothetical protein [Oligoflexia bacterium]
MVSKIRVSTRLIAISLLMNITTILTGYSTGYSTGYAAEEGRNISTKKSVIQSILQKEGSKYVISHHQITFGGKEFDVIADGNPEYWEANNFLTVHITVYKKGDTNPINIKPLKLQKFANKGSGVSSDFYNFLFDKVLGYELHSNGSITIHEEIREDDSTAQELICSKEAEAAYLQLSANVSYLDNLSNILITQIYNSVKTRLAAPSAPSAPSTLPQFSFNDQMKYWHRFY